MSNNIYNILNNFNKVAQAPVKPATQTQPRAKTQLQESMDQVLSEKYMGFKKTVAAVKKSGADNPEAVAASIGRKKYGKEKFQKAAAAGKKLGEANSLQSIADKDIERDLPAGDGEGGYVKDIDSLQSMADKDIERDLPPGDGTGGYVKDIDVDESALQAYLGNKKYGKEGMDALRKAGREGASKETMAKIRAKHDKMDEAAKPDYIDLDKDGNKDEPMKKAAKDAKSKKVQEVAPPGAKSERMVKHIKKGYAKDGKLTKTEKSKAYGAAWKAHNKSKVEEAIKAMMEAGFTKEQIVEGWDDMMKAVANRSTDMKTGEKRQGAKGEIEKTASGIKHTRRYDSKTGETETGSDGEQVKRGRGRPKKSAFESASKDSTTINKMIVETFRDIIEGSIQGGVWTSNPPKKGQPNVPVPQNPDGGSVSPATKTPSKPAPSTPKTLEPPMGSIKGGVWTAEPPKPGEKPVPVPQNPEVAKEGDEQLTLPPTDPKEIGAVMGTTVTSPAAQALIKSPQGQQQIKAMTDPKNTVPAVTATLNPMSDEESTAMMQSTNEADMEEGNAFSGAVAKAKADGVQPGETIKVGGKTYPVKEGEELLQMLRIAGIKVLEDTQLDECGMSSMGNGMMGQHEREGRMNVSTNMSSDGTKSVTITADGDSATELMQMLKLAGMGGGDHSEMPAEPDSEPEGIMVVSHDDEEEEVAEEKDERYHASTTPEEHVMPVQVQTKGGNGDVAGKEKKMTPNGYQFGDNPQAMKESMSLKLIKEYEAIKVKK